MSIPEVLQVVVVRRRAAALDLRDDPAPLAEPVGEVRARPGHEAPRRGVHDLLAEAHLAQQPPDDVLHLRARGLEHVDAVDLQGVAGQVLLEPCRDAVDDVDLCLLGGRERAAHEACVAGRHAVELRRPTRRKLAPIEWHSSRAGRTEPQCAAVWSYLRSSPAGQRVSPVGGTLGPGP